MKKIAAITMVRNDDFYLKKWVEYYGRELGSKKNLYIYFDGVDQEIGDFCHGTNTFKVPKIGKKVVEAEKGRLQFLSWKAAELLSSGYDLVIGVDADEFWTPSLEKRWRSTSVSSKSTAPYRPWALTSARKWAWKETSRKNVLSWNRGITPSLERTTQSLPSWPSPLPGGAVSTGSRAGISILQRTFTSSTLATLTRSAWKTVSTTRTVSSRAGAST